MPARPILILALFMTIACNAVPTAAFPMGDKAAPTPGLLLTTGDLASIRAHPEALGAILQRCPKLLDYIADPTAVLAPAQHYTASGVNHNGNDGKRLALDAQAAYRSGLCHTFTGDARFAAVTQRVLDAWAGTLHSVATPQGRDDVNFNLPYMIAAASWVQGVNGWNSGRFDAFLRNTVLPTAQLDNPNNHGAWAVLMTASAAAYLQDSRILSAARTRWATLLEGAIAADGTLTREISRSGTSNYHGGPDKGARGLAYTDYFLLPASLAAKVFADQNQPVWQTNAGKLLGLAFDRAAGWTLHPDTFPYYASNHGQLQDTRNVAYFALMLRYYPSRDAQAVIAQGDIQQGGFLLMNLYPLHASSLPPVANPENSRSKQ